MIPHGRYLMFPAPINPVNNPLQCLLKKPFDVMPEEFSDIAFTQTRKPRPFLNSSRLDEDGLCCCMVILSIELYESHVRSAKAKHAKVICLYQPE